MDDRAKAATLTSVAHPGPPPLRWHFLRNRCSCQGDSSPPAPSSVRGNSLCCARRRCGIKSHPNHVKAAEWHHRAISGELGFLVYAHTLLELYAVLTRLPLRPQLEPAIALKLVRENVLSHCRPVVLGTADHEALLMDVSALGLAGAVVYDALVARAATISGADILLTLHPGDFRRVWPEGVAQIQVP